MKQNTEMNIEQNRENDRNPIRRRIRPNYEALNGLGARIHFSHMSRSNNRAEGSFSSVYRGRSMEMEDLRLYVPGDNLRDMDWKASSRAGEPMVRNYVADKRKKILFLGDTGVAMNGTMPTGYVKKDAVILTIGSAAYLAGRGGADYAVACAQNKAFDPWHFRSSAEYLEEQLTMLEDCMEEAEDQAAAGKKNRRAVRANKAAERTNGKGRPKAAENELNELLREIMELPLKGVSIFLVTDLFGLVHLDETLLRSAARGREFYIFEIADAGWGKSNFYRADTRHTIPGFFSFSGKLAREIAEQQSSKKMQVRQKLRRSGVVYAHLEDTREIPEIVTKVLNGEITD